MRIGAWLPWLVLHTWATWVLFKVPGGGIKLLVPLVLYGLLSWVLGLFVCYSLRKDRVSVLLAAVLLFGGPFFSFGYLEARANQRQDDFLAARDKVEQLCEQYGGKKIYRTVDNVEGVFQMRARNPSHHALRDPQMADPWGRAYGDGYRMGHILALEGKGYFFVEQQPEYSEPEGPPFYRTYLAYNEKKMRAFNTDHSVPPHLFYGRHTIEIAQLRSKYGWLTEDLTTQEMRKLWIGGGRIKVLDLESDEILAEYTGFFRAVGPHGRYHWSNISNGVECAYHPYLGKFLREVLKPVQRIPSAEELQTYKE